MIEAPEPPHQHRAAGIPWFDLTMGLAILCISIASLLTSLQSERSMRALVEQNSRLVSAQSTPLLMLDSGNDENGKSILSMRISNVGTGPAQIGWFRATDAEGNDFSSDAIGQRVAKLDPNAKFGTQPIGSTLMRSGDERLVFSWPRPAGNPAALAEWDRVNHARFNLHASACYCSIFNECKSPNSAPAIQGRSNPVRRIKTLEIGSRT